MVLPVPISILLFLSKTLQIHSGMVIRRLRTLKICCSVNKLMLQLVLYLMVVSHLCLISQYCIYCLTVNNPSPSHARASKLTLSNDSDQDYQMDVSPLDNRFTSNGFNICNTPIVRSQPFGQSFGQMPQRAKGFQPSMLVPMGQHSGWSASNNSFIPGFFALILNQSTSVLPPIFAGPSSGVLFEASTREFNPNQFNSKQYNQFNSNQPNPARFNQSNSNPFNQSHSNSFNQFNSNQFNQFNSNSFNQSNPNSFNQFNPNLFNQLYPNQFNQLTPTHFNQLTPNQFNPSALSLPFSTPVANTSPTSLVSTPVVFTIGTAPPPQLDRHSHPVKNKSGCPIKKLL